MSCGGCCRVLELAGDAHGDTHHDQRCACGEREFFIGNLQVRILLIIEMIWWTGLTPWEFKLPFPGSLIFTFLPQTWAVNFTASQSFF